MKLQRHFAFKYKDRVNYKYVVVIPSSVVEHLGWNNGNELKAEVKGNVLYLKPFEKMDYDEFKLKISQILKENPKGLTWTAIRDKVGLYQKYPNNKWVNRLEKDISLNRKKNRQQNSLEVK